MGRLPRIHLEGALYLVTSRGVASTPAWSDPADYETYIGLLKDYQQRYGFRLFGYCLLPDHVHLCLQPSAGMTISAIMHDLTTRYTKHFNKRYGRSGPLFQERFKAVVVEPSSVLLELTAYLHMHPVRSGLSADPASYPFSSYSRYLSAGAPADGTALDATIQKVLNFLPEDRTPAAYAHYVNTFSTAQAARIHAKLQKPVLGSDAFVEMVEAHRVELTSHAPSPATPHLAQQITLRRPAMPLVAGRLVVAMALFGLIALPLFHRVAFLERVLSTLSLERLASLHAPYSLAVFHHRLAETPATLDGTVWDIHLVPIEAKPGTTIQQDQLLFSDRRVSSKVLSAQGVSSSRYTVAVTPNGAALWEAMQTAPNGEVMSWKGEWKGITMRGTLTRQSVRQPAAQFTFVGIVPRATDSQTRSET